LPNGRWGVLIADDEPAARRGVRQLLAGFPEFAVVGECSDGTQVLTSLDTLHPHVVFLDIQMPGVDGFEVIRRRTPERMPVVVFLTAFDEFAIRAFEAQALDYLLKPATEARFAATMKRLTRQLQGSTPKSSDHAIVVTDARGTTVLPMADIDWIEAADNYARLWVGARNYLLREPLGRLEERVRAHGFLRAHRRALVRLDAVRRVIWTDAGELVALLVSGGRVPISRRRRAEFTAAVKGKR
jgi:two-component system, LytTR family, response regulator